MPADTPVTIPAEPTDAFVLLLLLHVPPMVASLRDVVNPLHTPGAPDIVAGNAPTVIMVVALHPVDNK